MVLFIFYNAIFVLYICGLYSICFYLHLVSVHYYFVRVLFLYSVFYICVQRSFNVFFFLFFFLYLYIVYQIYSNFYCILVSLVMYRFSFPFIFDSLYIIYVHFL